MGHFEDQEIYGNIKMDVWGVVMRINMHKAKFHYNKHEVLSN
jgi:hypothetical protein